MDEDGSGTISAVEFDALSFLFNFKRQVVKDIFTEFDISGDQASKIEGEGRGGGEGLEFDIAGDYGRVVKLDQ